MGYTTDFVGQLELTPAATPEQIEYINLFSSTRRMARDSKVLMEKYKGKHGLDGKYGTQGEYFCKDDGNMGQDENTGVIDHNAAPKTQPGLWCQWELSDDGNFLQWDGGEKFYNYVDWLKYLINNFFTPWNITLSGEIKWQGEDFDDRGKILVENNGVKTIDLE
jgi:hypothetical protein